MIIIHCIKSGHVTMLIKHQVLYSEIDNEMLLKTSNNFKATWLLRITTYQCLSVASTVH